MVVHHPYITVPLLAAAVLLAFFCSLGLAIMRDPYQRLHFATPVVSISTLLIAIAVWLEDSDPQSRMKVILVGVILFVMNAILSHATGRAFRIRTLGRWQPKVEEHLPLVDAQGHPKSVRK